MIPYRQTGGLGWLGDGLLTKAKGKFQLVEYGVNAKEIPSSYMGNG